MNKEPSIRRWIPPQDSQDGDGVKIRRIAGRHINQELDPFLLLDELKAEDGKDYMGGFPPHPHRGFETMTYMRQGRVRHRDHMGNEGLIGPGDVQWMSAGSGVIHSEMPEQQDGLFHGFQIWLNLPANKKMKPAEYRDIPGSELVRYRTTQGARIIAIAGKVGVEGEELVAPIQVDFTEPLYLDIELPQGSEVELCVSETHNSMLYVYEGAVDGVSAPSLGIYSDTVSEDGSNKVKLSSTGGAKALFLAGRPLNEPIVQHGPFVMNTQEQINQAIEDYQNNRLV